MKDDHAQLLRTALEHHQAGRYAEAEALYQKALAQQPKDPEAVHGLGFLRFHQQRLPEAIELIQQAITLQPNQPRYHHNLAEAYRAGRQFEEAIAAYQQALKLRPYYPIALNNLGNTYLAMDRFDDAAIALRQAIGLQQQFPEAHYNLGLVYYGQNQPVEAAKCLYVALEQRPTYMKACHSLSTILQNLRRPEDAVACLFHALQMDPKNPALHNNLGIMHIELAHYDEAEKYLRQALELVPDMPEAHANLANMMRRLPAPESERKARGAARAEAERLQTILEHHEQALRVRPNYADSLAGYAVTLFCMPGRLQDAMAAAHNALRINSDPKESIWSYWNLALLQLMHGDFENGWQAAEVRLKMPTIFAGFPSKQRVWDGSTSLKGKTLLVSSEQGLGDNIQMVRYVPILADMGASVVVQTRPQLVRLLKTVRGAEEVVSREEPLPEHDLQIPMMSLPHRFKTNLETIPHEVPYLRADPANTPASLREKKTGTFKVGLSWCGSPDNISNIYRSIRLAELSPLARIPGVEFYSLQKGPGEEEVAKLPAEFPVVNLSKEIKDLADTAAAIMEMDLVIAVDTAVAHLAGALGQPVWMLLYYPGEWRWLLERTDSPWYPTMRIFRQKDRGDWEPLIREVAGELAKTIPGG